MTKVLGPSNITGTFDSTTEQAVKDFQQGAGLTVDGIVGPITWQALPADPNTPLLARGASGSVVTALQKGLKKYSTPATDPGAVDGDFGPKTELLSKLTNRIGVSKRTESSATRRGGLRQAPRGRLLRRYRDLRRCDFESGDRNVADHTIGPRLIAINDDGAPAFARRSCICALRCKSRLPASDAARQRKSAADTAAATARSSSGVSPASSTLCLYCPRLAGGMIPFIRRYSTS